MNSNQIRYFIEVSERLNFTSAAEHLYMAQSTLSRQIALLEEEFGTQFFNRDKSGITLTPAGRIFYEEAKKSYEAERQLRISLDAASRGYEQNLKIAFLEETVPNPRLIKAIQTLHGEHPEIDIRIRVSDVHSLYLDMENGSIDVAMTLRHNVNVIKNIECIELSKDEMSLAIISEYPLPEKEYLTAADLEGISKDMEFLMLSPEVFTKQIEKQLRRTLESSNKGRLIEQVRFTHSAASIAMHVVCGLAVTLAYDSHWLSTAPGVSQYRVEGTIPTSIVLAYKNDNKNPALNAFRDTLSRELACPDNGTAR